MSNRRSTLDDAQRAWVRDWWRALQPREKKSQPLSPALAGLDRGTRAVLRRADNGDDLLLESSTHLLAERLVTFDAHRQRRHLGDATAGHQGEAFLWIALAAGVLAHVRDDAGDDRSLASRLGRAVSDPPPMSELRFKRLLKADDEVDLLRQWRRAVALADGKTDVAQLADDLLSWQIERARPQSKASDSVKFRWAYHYYLNKREQAAGEEPASIKEMTE